MKTSDSFLSGILFQVFFILAIMLMACLPLHVRADTITLYDSSSGDLPADQGWIYGFYPLLSPLGTNAATQSLDIGDFTTTRLDTSTSNSDSAGYFSSTPEYTLSKPPFPPVTFPADSHPDMPSGLDADKGFIVSFEVQILQEDHDYADRAGFSVIVTSSEPAKAVELGFWEGEIWAQEGGTDSLFTHAEGAAFDTTAKIVRYDLKISGNVYRLFADGLPVLNGPLRDYTAFSGQPPFDYPYKTPDFLFLGDDTSSAGATILLKSVSITRLLPGDINDDSTVDLRDAILILKILAGIDTGDAVINLNADVNGDGKIGMEEVIYILGNVSQG